MEEIHDALFEEKQISVFVKRDDLIHPIISGNKWRKLREYIQFAQLNGLKQLISFGGAYSNHLFALAYACHCFGLTSVGIIRGEELTAESNPYLKQMKQWGMTLYFISRADYQTKFIPFEFNPKESLCIDEGGFGLLALEGLTKLVDELSELPNINHIICPMGTGATYLGLIKAKNNAKIHGIFTLNNRTEIIENATKMEVEIQEMHANYIFGKYAKQSTDLDQFCEEFYAKHQIKIEPIYTGRMFYGLYDLIKTDYFCPGSQILAIHTGGIKF